MEFARKLRASMEDLMAGDPSSTLAIWHPEIRWYAVGQNPLAARLTGHEDVMRYLGELKRLSGGTFETEILEVRPMFAGTYVARFRIRAQAGAARLDALSSLIMDSDGECVTSVVEVHHQERAWDEFWTSAAEADGATADPDPDREDALATEG